jgi:hypothetical protein
MLPTGLPRQALPELQCQFLILAQLWVSLLRVVHLNGLTALLWVILHGYWRSGQSVCAFNFVSVQFPIVSFTVP